MVAKGQLYAHVNNTYVVKVLDVDDKRVYYASKPNQWRTMKVEKFLQMFERVYEVRVCE